MKAFAIDKYGSNDNVRAVEVPDPELRDDDVLVEINAASINPLDARIRDGKVKTILPYRLPLILGNDLAGVVVRVGSAVRRFKPGDQVYARPDQDRIGSFAERTIERRGKFGRIGHDRSLAEAGFVEREQFNQVRRVQIRPCVRLHQFARPGKLVPRANRQAIITAENTVADGAPEFDRN